MFTKERMFACILYRGDNVGKEIIGKVKKYRDGESECLIEIITLFNPVLSKYSKLVDGEDTKQDLIIHLIKVLNNAKFYDEKLCEDKIIFSYILKSIRREYIRLSKNKNKISFNETELNLDMEVAYDGFENEFELMDMLKILSQREAYIIKLMYIYYLSASEIAEYMKISRQAVNQTKNRALKRLENYIYNKKREDI